jgi:hypothetical protein
MRLSEVSGSHTASKKTAAPTAVFYYVAFSKAFALLGKLKNQTPRNGIDVDNANIC